MLTDLPSTIDDDQLMKDVEQEERDEEMKQRRDAEKRSSYVIPPRPQRAPPGSPTMKGASSPAGSLNIHAIGIGSSINLEKGSGFMIPESELDKMLDFGSRIQRDNVKDEVALTGTDKERSPSLWARDALDELQEELRRDAMEVQSLVVYFFLEFTFFFFPP